MDKDISQGMLLPTEDKIVDLGAFCLFLEKELSIEIDWGKFMESEELKKLEEADEVFWHDFGLACGKKRRAYRESNVENIRESLMVFSKTKKEEDSK